MNVFNFQTVGKYTLEFFRNPRFKFNSFIQEEGDRSLLIKAENIFSSLYVNVTMDINVIKKWPELQRELYSQKEHKLNQYLIYLFPRNLIQDNYIYQELAFAERNEFYFRKIFIDVPTKNFSKNILFESLLNRIPVWSADKEKIIENIPNINIAIKDNNLIELIEDKERKNKINVLDQDQKYVYLFEEQFPGIDREERNSLNDNIYSVESRLQSISLENFRGFEEELSLDMDYDVILIYGKNGRGKTSISDAIEFAMFNKIQRLGNDPDSDNNDPRNRAIINKYSENSIATIKINGISNKKKYRYECRIKPDSAQNYINNNEVSQKEALYNFTSNRGITIKKEYLDVLLHTHFLNQESIRDFIYGGKYIENDEVRTRRYDLILELFGFGRIEKIRTSLQAILSQIKRNNITKLQEEIDTYKTIIRGSKIKFGKKTRTQIENDGILIDNNTVVSRIENLSSKLIKYDISLNIRESTKTAEVLELLEMANVHLSGIIKKYSGKERDIFYLKQYKEEIEGILKKNFEKDGPSFIIKVHELLKSSFSLKEQYLNEIKNLSKEIESDTKIHQKIQGISSQFSDVLEIKVITVELKNQLIKLKDKLYVLRKKIKEINEQESILTHKISENEKIISKYEKNIKAIKELQDRYSQYVYYRSTIGDKENAVNNKSVEIKNITLDISRFKERSFTMNQPSDLKEILTDYNIFQDGKNNYYCPCCRQSYLDGETLYNNIKTQIISSSFKNEVSDFIYNLIKKHYNLQLEDLNVKLLKVNDEFHNVKGEFLIADQYLKEYESAIQSLLKTKEINNDVFIAEINMCRRHISEIKHNDYPKLLQKIQNEKGDTEREISTIDINSLLKEIAKNEKFINSITAPLLDYHKGVEINNKSEIFLIIDEINNKINMNKNILASKQIEIKKILQITDRSSDILSLIHKCNKILDTYQNESIDVIENINISELISLQNEIELLSNILGILRLEEDTTNFSRQIEKLTAKISKWKICYENLKKMKEKLDQLQKKGLELSISTYNPLINEIYKKFIRHDKFDHINLNTISSPKGKKKNLYLNLVDYNGKSEFTPASYLSEAQLNILALSIFISRVIYQNFSSFQTIIIDDPIQHMDDMNSTSFIDIIIGLSLTGKQFIITTCDYDFYTLFSQKLIVMNDFKNNKKAFCSINLDELLDKPLGHNIKQSLFN